MKIKDIVWFDRPWEKIKRNGVNSLSDSELLAVIFNDNYGLIRANELLNNHNMNEFSCLDLFELNKILGDKRKSYQILCLGELFIRYSKLVKKGFKNSIENSKDVYNLFYDELKDKKKEYFYR